MSAEKRKKFWCFTLTGPAGVGKTTVGVSTWPQTDEYYPMVLIDVDNKADAMWNIGPLIESGKVIVLPVESPFTADTLLERAMGVGQKPSKAQPVGTKFVGKPQTDAPQGWLELCKLVDDAVDALADPNGKIAGIRPKSIGLDSISRALLHHERHLTYMNRERAMSISTWGDYRDGLADLITKFFVLPCHKWLTLHDRSEPVVVGYDERGQEIKRMETVPLISGQMQVLFNSFFNECYYLRCRPGPKPIYEFLTRQVGENKCARSSMNFLNIWEPASLAGIIAKWQAASAQATSPAATSPAATPAAKQPQQPSK